MQFKHQNPKTIFNLKKFKEADPGEIFIIDSDIPSDCILNLPLNMPTHIEGNIGDNVTIDMPIAQTGTRGTNCKIPQSHKPTSLQQSEKVSLKNL